MNFFSTVANLLESSEHFVLVTVLKRSGSAPRSAGARMIVRSDGSIIGTVGGGLLEASVIQMAGDVFRNRLALIREFRLSEGEAGRLGMLCGGRVEILMQFMDSSITACLDFYREVAAAISQHTRSWLVTGMSAGDGSCEKIPPQWLLTRAGETVGLFGRELLDKDDILRELQAGHHGYCCVGEERYHVEALYSNGTAFIFGAGHVGRALAQLTSMVSFKTVVIDDREEYAARSRLEFAQEVIVPHSFDRAMEALTVDDDSYIVIVTRGHMYDCTILGQALKTGAAYIGMIGSRKKRATVYEALMAEYGYGPRDFARVHSPIGLPIGAETPEEIAVCIVAEMIQARAEKNQ